MSAFPGFATAMDNHANRTTIPSKPGTMVRKTVGHTHQAALLELWTMLKRGTESGEISRRVDSIVNSATANTTTRTEIMTLLCRAIVQKRDCRNGGGEKDVVYHALMALRQHLPQTTLSLIKILPAYGYYKDLTLLANCCKQDAQLLANIVTIMATGIRSKNTLACKWAPREKKAGAWLAELVRKELSMSKKSYRQHLSKIMLENATKIPEVLMSSKRFREIEPSHVPSRCLKIHRRAFIDEDKHGMRRHVEDDDPQLADREICRKKFEEHLNQGKSVKGARNFPYEIVRQARKGVVSDLERKTLNAMWQAIVDEVKQQIQGQQEKDQGKETSQGETKTDSKNDEGSHEQRFDPSKMVPMCDVSGSMTCAGGVPMENSIALGLLLSEVGHPSFRGRVLTFHSQPSWVVFDQGLDFVGRVNVLQQAAWGQSTNFEAAMGLIADVVLEHNLSENQVPGIVCFSDMKFNAAMGGNNGYGNTGNAWGTHYERIEALFQEIGNKIAGSPYLAPRICFWDLANSGGGQQPGFPVRADDKGVQLISGFSPALLKFVMTGERLETPWCTFLKAVKDKRYDDVERVALEALEIDPSFVQ